MEAEQGAKVEIQLAARDSNTRKLVSQMGKRHKWVASDISTSRQLLSVAMIILRNLGIEANHQVILYPDISVHTHLKYTPVSWGPTFDPTLPLRDIHKTLGSPAKLHFLYHIIAPEALSPPGKTPRQDVEQDSWGMQQLQPRQLSFAGRQGNQQQPQLQQPLLVSKHQQAAMHEAQPASQQPQHMISQPCSGHADAAATWSMGASWHGQQQQQTGTAWQPQQHQQQQDHASAALAGVSGMNVSAQPPLQRVHEAYQRQPQHQQQQQGPIKQLQSTGQQCWAEQNQRQQTGQPLAGPRGVCANYGQIMSIEDMVQLQTQPAPGPRMQQPVLSEQIQELAQQQQQMQQPWVPQINPVSALQLQQQQQPVMQPCPPQSGPESAPWSSQWLPGQQPRSSEGLQTSISGRNPQLQAHQQSMSLLPSVQHNQQVYSWPQQQQHVQQLHQQPAPLLLQQQQQTAGLPVPQHCATSEHEQQQCGTQAPLQAQQAPYVGQGLQLPAGAADGVAGAVPCRSHQSSQYSCGHMQQQQHAQQIADAQYAAQQPQNQEHPYQQPQQAWSEQPKAGEAAMQSSTAGRSPVECTAATVPSQQLATSGTANNIAHSRHMIPSAMAMLAPVLHFQQQQSQQPQQQITSTAAQTGQLHSRPPSPKAPAAAAQQPAAGGGAAAVRLAIRSADGGVFEVPLICSDDNGRVTLLPAPSLEIEVKQQLQMQLQQGMQPSAQLVALLQALEAVTGSGTERTAAVPAGIATPNPAHAASSQQGPPSPGAPAALTMQQQEQWRQQPGQQQQQQQQQQQAPHSQLPPCVVQQHQRQQHMHQLQGVDAAQLPNQHHRVSVDGYQQPPDTQGQCSLRSQQQPPQVHPQHVPRQQVPVHAQVQQHAVVNSQQQHGIAEPQPQQVVLNAVEYKPNTAVHTEHQLVSAQYQQLQQQVYQGLSHVPQASAGAAAISAAALSGFAAVSSGPSAAASPALQEQADLSSPGADLRSHCSSVSCGGAASGAQAGTGKLSSMAAALNSTGSADLAAAGGSLVPDGGGSVTRSSQQKDQVQQQQQQQAGQRQSAVGAAVVAAGGRGVLQPRQLQLNARPQQQQQQAHWQPQLQSILEMEGSRDSVPSAMPAASAGAAVAVGIDAQGAQATHGTPAVQASPTADGGVSGALELQLDDDGCGDGASQQPPCQQHAQQSQPDMNASSDDDDGNDDGGDDNDDADSDGHDGYQDDATEMPSPEPQHSGLQEQQQHGHDASQVKHQTHSSSQLQQQPQQQYMSRLQQNQKQQHLGQIAEPQPVQQTSQQHSIHQSAQLPLELQQQSLPQQSHSPASYDSRANAQHWNQQSCMEHQQQQQSFSGVSGGFAAGMHHSNTFPSQSMSGKLEQQQQVQKLPLPPSTGGAMSPPAIKLGTSLMLGMSMGMQPPANRSFGSKIKAKPGSKPKRKSYGFNTNSSFYSNYYQYPPGKYPRLAANLTHPADQELRLPSIISSGASCKGTWHSSTNNWDSRDMQTPLKPDEIAVGSIFSVEELRRQSEMQRQQQQAAEAPAGGGSSSSSGSKRAAQHEAAVGVRPSKQTKAGLRQKQQQGGPQQEQQQQALPSMQQLQPHGCTQGQQEQIGQQQQQQQHVNLQPQQQDSLPQQRQVDPEAEAVSAGGPYSQPGSTSLGGWCTVAPAGHAGSHAGGASGPNSTAVDAGNRASPESADDAGTAPVDEPAGRGGRGQRHSGMPAGAEQHQKHYPQLDQHAKAADQNQNAAGRQAAVAEAGAAMQPPPPPQQQQQRQRQSQQQAQWPGFQAAAPTSNDGASPDALPTADAPGGFADADAVGCGEQLAAEEPAAEPGHDGLEIDMAALDEVLNAQSLLDLEQAQEHQQTQQAAGTAAAAAADNTGSGGITMHEALKAAGIIPPSPVSANAAQPAITGAMHSPSLQMPPVATQHVPNQAVFGCQQGDHQRASIEQLQQQAFLSCGNDSPGKGDLSGVHVTRQRARSLAAAVVGAVPAPVSSGEGWSTGDEGQQAAAAISSTGQSDKPRKARRRSAKCRVPLPPVEQLLTAAPSGPAAVTSKAPLPPPAGAVCNNQQQGKGTAAAAPALQRVTLADGSTIFVAGAKPGAPAVQGRQPKQQQQQHPLTMLPTLPLLGAQQLSMLGTQPLPLLPSQLQQQHLLQALQMQAQQPGQQPPPQGTTKPPLPQHGQQVQQQLSAPASNDPAAAGGNAAAATGMQTPMGGVSASQLAAALHRMAAATGAQPGTAATAAAAPAGDTTATEALSASWPPAMPLSGLITPNFLSPTKLISPAGPIGAAGAGAIQSMTVDCLEALLGDKELNFLSPDKSLYMFNNNSTLGGLLSCLASPANMLFSPVKASQQDHNRGQQQQHPQQHSGQAGAGTGGIAGGTGGPESTSRPASATDFRSLFQSFKEGSSSDAAAGHPAGQAAAGATAQGVPPVVSADVGSGPGDQLQQEQELCQYLLGNGNDSWLMPPPAVTDSGNANAAAGPDAAAAKHAAAAAAAARGGMIRKKGGTRARKQSAQTNASNEKAQQAATAAVQSHRKPARAGEGQGPRRGAASGRPAKQQGPAGRPTQAAQPAQQQKQQAAAYNPDKPFAALFPSVCGNQQS